MTHNALLRTAMDSVDVVGSETHTDPKQLRKLRQQQLQQKFRREMEARKLHQKQDQTKSEDTEVTIGQGSSGGKGFNSINDLKHCTRLSLLHDDIWNYRTRSVFQQ